MTRAVDGLRAELADPQLTLIAIGALTIITFLLVRLTGGSPSALLELGFLPVAIAASRFGMRGGFLAGLVVATVLGPLPALLRFDHVEEPPAWLIRTVAFAGIGILIGSLLDRSERIARHARARLLETADRERQGLLALATAAESRESDAGEHVRRVEVTSRRLALAMGLSRAQAEDVGWSAMFHDLGKLRVPDRILLKPEPLNADEWLTVRLHPIWSEQALQGGESLALARQVARWHHENWDGTGYPDGLYGDRIPLAARIVRITDAFDAMTNLRPYQQPMSFEAALEELRVNAGHDFDPTLVQRFVELVTGDPSLRQELTDLRLV